MRGRRPFLLAIVLLLSACGGSGEAKGTAEVDDIKGDWTTAAGAHLSFEADHTFTSQGLRFDPSLAKGCPAGTGKGSWGFYVDEGTPGGFVAMSKEAPRGDTIGVTFAGIAQGDCSIMLSVLKSGELCASIDLDEVCSFSDRFTRNKATSTP
ncbi:hypothetical protein ACFWCB_05700 [Streptomyces sp. NPDC060048]|uniref:hypothetical protein n=1 Tax=unclassified Streptomyces TaxID=2593676 RepID=UPI0036B92BBC